jgi:hypothetical protein
VHSDVPEARNIDALFFILRWDRYRLHKKRVGTQYFKHVLLHPVGSAGRIVHSGASGAQNIDALFFMLAELVSLHPVGSAGHVVHSSASRARNIGAQFFKFGVGPVRFP